MTDRDVQHRRARAPRATVHGVGSDPVLRREAVTMGFYVCVTLFVAMAAGDDLATHHPRDVVALIWLATVGLALAHWLAATVANQLVADVHGHHRTIDVVVAHLLLPAGVATVASLAVLVVPNDLRLLVGRLTAAALLAVLVFTEARRGERSPGRAIRMAALSFACAAGIAVLKRFIL